jgi:hypothetical protein
MTDLNTPISAVDLARSLAKLLILGNTEWRIGMWTAEPHYYTEFERTLRLETLLMAQQVLSEEPS